MNLRKKIKRKIIKKTPKYILKIYANVQDRRRENRLKKITKKVVFTEIYQSNAWKGESSKSGTGSDTVQTQKITIELNTLINDFNIKSILDLPCGDFHWMKNVNLNTVKYKGGDIVDELIAVNNKKYASNQVSFDMIDVTRDKLPQVDLILMRDCLVHFSYTDIQAALSNVIKSKSKYMLTTTFVNRRINQDIVTGMWRSINLQQAPFHFPKPILVINENCTEGNGMFKDKSLALYLIEEIKQTLK